MGLMRIILLRRGRKRRKDQGKEKEKKVKKKENKKKKKKRKLNDGSDDEDDENNDDNEKYKITNEDGEYIPKRFRGKTEEEIAEMKKIEQERKETVNRTIFMGRIGKKTTKED